MRSVVGDLSVFDRNFYMRKLVLVFLWLPVFGFGQTVYSIHFHDSFEVSDSIQNIEFNLTGENTIEPWAGNTILVETKIASEDANERLLKYLKEKGRYEIDLQKNSETLVIFSKIQGKKGIVTKSGEIREKVSHTVFIPENFSNTGENTYRKND